jgi:hypothetical protein
VNAHDPNPPSGEATAAGCGVGKATAGETMSPQITLITKHDVPALMSKRISLTNDGNLKSDGSECRMITGTAAREFVGTASALALIIAACRSDQAITLGVLKAELPDSVAVTVPSKLANHPGAITRSRSCIDYRLGLPAWCLIDFDTKGMSKKIRERIDAAGGMWNALLTVAPELSKAARVSRASTTAGLFRSDTSEPIAGSNGMHHYVLVRDGGDVERFLKDLHERCWLHGLGWHLIGGAGQLLDRSIVDRMVGYGERLCFEGAPVIAAPLAQDQAKRAPEAIEGEAIDSTLAVPRLSEYERHRVNEAKAKSAKARGKSAAEVRDKHDKELAEKISAKTGTPIPTALRLVKARHRGVLYPDVELEFDHTGTVTVGTVLADPDRYVGETLADPMEGIDYGRCKAIVMKSDDGNLLIHSFAHGRSIYFLRHDLKSAKAAFAQVPGGGTVDHAMAILAQAELEPDELDQFITLVSKATKAGKVPLKARVKKERADRAAEAHEAFGKAKAKADGRVVQPKPRADGELGPIVTLVDDILSDDQSEEPPMRNASGSLVRVEEKEPWALHLLTADSANLTDAETAAMRAPVEPVLVELTPTGVELLIENYVQWIGQKADGTIYNAALPKPFIVALMEYPNSGLPVVRTINTSPLIAPSGRVIEGVGLDRKTGLFHRIDPVLGSCVPKTDPSAADIKEALNFLINEWLVDVALDLVGKCVAILLALTILQRALFPERPAFFVTAGQRGGGKTTLISMIIAAVLGRRPAAAAWSDSSEERKKALFSYLRQSVATLVWDNIARGSNISCPHIEAAITAPETSDRVLGVSEVESVPSTTVQIFTGNQIAPRGDMASRSFVLALQINRPDPENRPFVHDDPLSWTQENRVKILRALYTILKGGASERPTGQIAKTRFKIWWTSVGWSVEHAARLLGIDLDCSELLRAGEAEDQDASAASRVLTILWKRWSDKTFTARQVKLALDAANSVVEASAEQAQALADALAELADKPIDKLTAQGIGKLFQKSLTNRPAWIDGDVIAVLRKASSDHQENRYRVEVQLPDAPAKPEQTAAADDQESDPFG